MIRLLAHLIAGFALTAISLPAQDAAPPDSPDPQVSTDALTLSLEPLTKDELEAEADKWLTLLKGMAQEIADIEIAGLNGEGEGDAEGNLTALRDRKAAAIKRTGLVLDAYELKGGDAAVHRKYVAAVTDIQAGVGDVASRYNAFSAWLSSKDGGIKWLVNAGKFTAVLLLFWIFAAIASKLIRRAIDRQANLSALLKTFINRMSRRIIFVIGFVVALGTVGVNVGAALALIGGGAFILAFALQDTLSNFASGIMLIIYRPFDVGDAVEIGGVLGKVDGVSLVSTTILTFDNRKVLVPNKKVWGEIITNITGMPTRRVDMVFGIGYKDDVEKAQEIIGKVIREHPLVLAEPVPNIGVQDLGESSVNIRCWPWAMTSDFLTVRTEITKRVKEEFDAAGISIPFPQRDVHHYREYPEKAD